MMESLSHAGKEAEGETQTKHILQQSNAHQARSAREHELVGAGNSKVCYLDNKPKFSIVIVYEDGITGRRAKHFYDSLIHDLADACDFRLDCWSFRAISIPATGDLALELAGQADFVILSVRGEVKLPTVIRDWIDRWCLLTTDSKPTLVALFDQPNRGRGTVASTLQYLSDVTDRKNINFFPHTKFRMYD